MKRMIDQHLCVVDKFGLVRTTEMTVDSLKSYCDKLLAENYPSIQVEYYDYSTTEASVFGNDSGRLVNTIRLKFYFDDDRDYQLYVSKYGELHSHPRCVSEFFITNMVLKDIGEKYAY
ncbi:hypothetical protein VCHA53O466_40189 [Vibrio chagasii]|nr:hypothetical protein VCHA53O466_40189 [Vibrio chagasii]